MLTTPSGPGSFGDPMPSETEDTGSKAGRGTRAAVVGAVAGLVPAIVIGSLRFLADEPQYAEQLAGNAVFVLVYASPYLLTFIASKEQRPAVRGGLLAALGILSFAASFSSMSLATIALLPATFVIWFAAARSLTASVRPLATTLLAAIAGLAVAATVGLSFFVLVFGIQDPEVRCWVLTRGADGQSVWESRPNVSSSPGGMSVGLLRGNERGVCVSDIISDSEAAMSIGVLAIAFLGTLLISRRPWLLIMRSHE